MGAGRDTEGARKVNHLGFHGAGTISSVMTFPLMRDRSACVRACHMCACVCVRACMYMCVCQGGGGRNWFAEPRTSIAGSVFSEF